MWLTAYPSSSLDILEIALTQFNITWDKDASASLSMYATSTVIYPIKHIWLYILVRILHFGAKATLYLKQRQFTVHWETSMMHTSLLNIIMSTLIRKEPAGRPDNKVRVLNWRCILIYREYVQYSSWVRLGNIILISYSSRIAPARAHQRYTRPRENWKDQLRHQLQRQWRDLVVCLTSFQFYSYIDLML